MTVVQPAPKFWKDKRVLITGHTGFIGSWLAVTLLTLGAKVTGIALSAKDPSHYKFFSPPLPLISHDIDICRREGVRHAISEAMPEIVFHLAAQSLVREAYVSPAESFAVNTLGTVHVLEALRNSSSVKAAVLMTTDKVYRNHESTRPYQEEDELGGIEPYGSSKACAEIVAETYRSSYFAKLGTALATVRAGNVIGGGDFARDRIIPDYVRAIQAGVPINLRHPDATRPWQFVMEPVRACLILAEHMRAEPEVYSGAWNIGPDTDDNISVQDLIIRFGKIWGTPVPGIERDKKSSAPYEAKTLAINSSRIRTKTGWKPVKTFAKGLEATADWYKAYLNARDPSALSFKQAKEWIDA